MAWLSLRVAADGDAAEALADCFLEAGALTVSIEDRDAGTSAETAQFGEPGLDAPRAWTRNWVVALLEDDADVGALLAAAGLPADAPHAVEPVPEQDWVRLTQAQFDPIRISDRLWIVPTWHVDTHKSPDPAAINIVLDPGLAFGTGSHPTTRLCLRWLEAHIAGGEAVLDYGCGSGILAIAAARLGAAPVRGVDVDPQAVRAARDNAAANGVTAGFDLPDDWPEDFPDAAPEGAADILVANILTNPLKALMPLLAARVRPGGRIALSGILAAQAEDVLAVYRAHFDIARWREDEGWVCLSGVRRGGTGA